MTYEVAERILKVTGSLTEVDMALFAVIQSLAAEIFTLQGRIESLEELVPELAEEVL